MAQHNMNAYLRSTTETAYNNLVNDLSAMDETQAAGTPHEALRPTIKLVAECGSVNTLLASLVATGQATMPTPEEREAFYAGITTQQAALAVLEDGTQKLYAAIAAAAPDTWDDSISGPFGPWTRAAAAGFAALHMMYHDGQLNSVHLLHGDTEMHWK
jgi:hypothetical protein